MDFVPSPHGFLVGFLRQVMLEFAEQSRHGSLRTSVKFYACPLDGHIFPSLAPSTALNRSKIPPTLRSVIKVSPSTILPSSINSRRATPGRHPTWRGGVTHRPSRQKAILRMEVSITWPSERYSTTSLGVPGSMPTAGMPIRARARSYASRRVVFVLVKMEGDVGTVSRCMATKGSDVTKEEFGFSVAAKKRSSGLVNFWMGVDSTEIVPSCERTMRICKVVSFGIKPCIFSLGTL